MDISKLKAAQYIPDEFDKQCTAVMQSLPKEPVKERIALIEQVLEYLRMEEAYENMP